MQLATGFWASKAFLSAVELGVFGEFAEGALTLPELRKRLGLHERSARDFFDALVTLGLLQRDDVGRYNLHDYWKAFRRLRAKPDKKFVDGQAAMPSS